jgi:molybdopterin-guanine dinucleotide biosynthesis protein A
MTTGFAAVVLAGGGGTRLGGVDKPDLRLGDQSLLERTLDAVATADPVVVVGPERVLAPSVVFVREDPPGTGPLAALEVGLGALPDKAELVAVLAADHPYLTASTVARLREAVERDPSGHGAVLVDSQQRPQWLVGVWRVADLRGCMPTEVRDRPLRALFGVLAPSLVPAVGAEASDVDTPNDWRQAQSDLGF